MSQSAALQLIEERTFTARLNDRSITGLAVASAWEGFTKYATADGAHLVVLDAEQRIVTGTPTLLRQLGAGGEPQIGEAFEGGIYGGLTEVDGQPAYLILPPGESKDVSWDTAMDWAKLQRGDLPTRAEQRTLIENLKSEFGPHAYWSREQHAGYPVHAWLQTFDHGGQTFNRKSYAGRARAVRRLVIQ